MTNISTKSEPLMLKTGHLLAGNCLRQEEFARARRANDQNTFGNAPAQLLELPRIFQNSMISRTSSLASSIQPIK